MTQQQQLALKDLLFRMADDALIYAHRNSEWTGFGPTLEEDIAFSSIAQDKLGHALALYQLLEQLGEQHPDITAFTRSEQEFRCSQLVELPVKDYAFSLMRHFLFDTAERLRYTVLEQSSYEPLSLLARKVRGEITYHTFHANIWVQQLSGGGSEESKARMQSALNECLPLARGIFETTEHEACIIESKYFSGEDTLEQQWWEHVRPILLDAELVVPELIDIQPVLGGRKGFHTVYLAPLIEEMTVVFRIDPSAQW